MSACLRCGDPLPDGSRRDARYCGVRCRVAAFRGRGSGPRGTLPIRDDAGLWCPACARPVPFGRINGDALILAGGSAGGFTREGERWTWSIYARGDARATLPAIVLCPRCREALTVTAPVDTSRTPV